MELKHELASEPTHYQTLAISWHIQLSHKYCSGSVH